MQRILLAAVYIVSNFRGSAALASNTPNKRTTSRPRRATSNRNEQAVARRQSGVETKNRKRTPRWETEGDALYQELKVVSNDVVLSFEQAQHMLAKLAPSTNETIGTITIQSPTKTSPAPPVDLPFTSTAGTPQTLPEQKTAPPHTLWGTLPVGPVIKRRLIEWPEPTPVQTTAFSIIASKRLNNAVIASPTGTGKTLAYLVPLLATRNRKVPCGIIIVAPTVELALQIQREADKLWPPETSDLKAATSAVHVVGEHRNQNPSTQEESLLLCHQIGGAPILAGTPRMLRELLNELDDNVGDQIVQSIATSIQSNLKTVVLDEADRLLRTEGAARDASDKKQPQHNISNKRKKKTPTQCEILLSELPISLNRLQIICASATVGRTLRRQLMDLLRSPSMDKAAELITADARATGKNVDKRRSSLLPNTLEHSYRLLMSSDTGARRKNDTHQDTLEALCDVLANSLKPAPTLIFPGRVGVDAVRQSLVTSLGLQNLRSLSDVSSGDEGGEKTGGWQDMPVYVVPDKFGRGLDLPDLVNVILLSPPSSAAGYAHLAGRTGRNGRSGHVVTLVRPREAPRLVAIAELLGPSFDDVLASNTEVADADVIDVKQVETCNEKRDDSWAKLSESGFKRKTVAELTDYLGAQVSSVGSCAKR